MTRRLLRPRDRVHATVNKTATARRPIEVWVLALAFYSFALVAAFQIIVQATSSCRTVDTICSYLDLKGTVDLRQNLNPAIHLGPFTSYVHRRLELSSKENAEREMEALKGLAAYAKKEAGAANRCAWTLLQVAVLFLAALVVFTSARGPHWHQELVLRLLFHLLCTSLIFLVIGLLAPVITLVTSPNVPLFDQVVIQSQSRSITSTITSLFSSGNWVVGALITLFSVITPLAKTTLMFFALFSQSDAKRIKIGKFLGVIGRWSMADVLVAAVLLACFGLRADKATVALPNIGLYYFAGYCVLSLLISHWIESQKVEDVTAPRTAFYPSSLRRTLAPLAAVVFCVAFAGVWFLASGKRITNLREAAHFHVPIELRHSTENLSPEPNASFPLFIPYAGILTLDIKVDSGREMDLSVVTPEHWDAAMSNKPFTGVPEFQAGAIKALRRSAFISPGKYYLLLRTKSPGIFSKDVKEQVEVNATLDP